MKNLLIKNGRLIDPGQGIEGNFDIAIAEGKVTWIGSGQPPKGDYETIDVTNQIVAPGFIDTGMTQKLSENVKQECLKQIPLGYFGLPKDVAYAVAFLVSEEAHYITGQVINVNGGLAMI